MLIDQSWSNAKAIQGASAGDALVRLKAFDLGALYAEAALAAGDYLDLELADPEGSRFLVRPLKAASLAPERRRAWFAALGEGTESAMRELGRPVPPLSFIAAAFAAAPAHLREDPAAAFSEYFNESKALQIKEFGGKTFMWARDADILALLMSAPGPDREGGDEDGLSRALAELGFALDADEVEAFVRDALWRGEGIEEALDRCFAGAADLGMPQTELGGLLDEAREFARRVAATEDPLSGTPKMARLRSSLLDLYAPFLAWMRRLGALVSSSSDLDTEQFTLLSSSMQGVCELIALLGEGRSIAPREFADFEMQLPALGAMTRELMDAVEAGLGGGRRPGRPAPKTRANAAKKSTARGAKGKTKAQRPASEKLYTFEAHLADIAPPIRRRLVVPGNRSLADLHRILQRAFGWTDSHLHCFRLRGTVYGEPSPEDFEPLLDERKILLDELSLRARSAIEYDYDYGDDWKHKLVVVATRKAAPGEDEAPRCLEVERAAPPEDCGGVPGYEELLEAMAAPADKRDEEQAELVEWAGDWDPESCDLAGINKSIKRA